VTGHASLDARHDRVSVVVTVLNEAGAVGNLLDDLTAQDLAADEIVVVDGGSSDGTPDVVRRYANARLIEQPGANISQGRNRGIEAARNELVAVTDAGVRLGADWLRLISAPLREGRADMVAGFFQPDPHSAFERAMGATVLPALEDVDPATFLPSSRSVAFQKEVWRQVGGYPEWLDYCEDLIFDINSRAAANVRVVFEARAVARFRPRSSLRAFFRQYFRYARGDGKADLWGKRHAARYVAYACALALGMAWGRPDARRHALSLAAATSALVIGAGLYARAPMRRLLEDAHGRGIDIGAEAALVPVIRVVGDMAKMAGYPVGWWWRLKHRPEDWRR
jgi:glycosyltransferase involved in cell wall biosynthesis